MKIVVTGASGFIGSRVLDAARLAFGGSVTARSARPAEGSRILYRDQPGFGTTSAELTVVENAEVLIHAGAYIPKNAAEANNITDCNSNITSTEKLLALPWKSLKKIVFLSSVDVYANVDGPISEMTPTVPASLYGLSKLYCEHMIGQYAAERGITNQVLRIGHVYGPGEEKYAKVLPKAIQNIVAEKDVELWGEGKELRSFIYIDDVVTAILKAVELRVDPGVINVVGGHAISIRNLLEKLISIGGRGTSIVRREFSGITRDLVFDNTKLKHYLLPVEIDFETGLKAEFQHSEGIRRLP